VILDLGKCALRFRALPHRIPCSSFNLLIRWSPFIDSSGRRTSTSVARSALNTTCVWGSLSKVMSSESSAQGTRIQSPGSRDPFSPTPLYVRMVSCSFVWTQGQNEQLRVWGLGIWDFGFCCLFAPPPYDAVQLPHPHAHRLLGEQLLRRLLNHRLLFA
jgi:hypothetical protein